MLSCVSFSMFILRVSWNIDFIFFNIIFSRIDLDDNAREVRGSLYCLPCHNKLDLPVCSACRRLIDDRVISALGKQWHVEVWIDWIWLISSFV
jgi:hypothetical protein